MDQISKSIISDKEKEKYISALTSELPMLRAKAVISQDELASLIGVSRQTYGSIERLERPMGWNTFLALIFVFDNYFVTRKIIRSLDAFPEKFIDDLNGSAAVPDRILSKVSDEYGDVFDKLDEQALHTIRTMVMIEYARCTNQSGDAVVKSFDGVDFLKSPPDPSVSQAIRNIRGNSGDE